MTNIYDNRYKAAEYYWGKQPSESCYRVLALRPHGLHAFSVLIEKPFIPPAPDAEPTAHLWVSGEILTHYHDWIIEYFAEDIFDCMSSGVPHKHAVNRIIARRPSA
jgi:hypothetical protein